VSANIYNGGIIGANASGMGWGSPDGDTSRLRR
jgi:hypothetical protein